MVQLALLTAALSVKFWKWDFDDGFIVYRYVENILAGRGWVYNSGESYNASTSALNTILIAAISFCGFSPSAAAHLIGACSLFVMAGAIYFIFTLCASRWFAATASSLCLFVMANNFTWGLESHLFYGLLMVFICLEVHGRTSWLLLGALILARPDALILLAIRSFIALRGGSLPLAGILRSAFVVLPWALYSLFTFGNIFPATLQQKMWQGASGFWGTGWIFARGLFGYIRGISFTHLTGVYWAPVVLSVPLVLVPQGMLFCLSRMSRLLLFFAYIASVLVIYTVLNVPNYHWYYVGFLLAVYIAAGFGVLFVVAPYSVRTPPLVNGALSLVLALLSAAMLYQATPDFFDVRTDVYRTLSEKITAATDADSSVAAAEVGVVGYYSRRKMIDLVGLTTPYGEYITGARTPDLIDVKQPQAVIFHHPLMPHEQAVYGDSLFTENYRLKDIVAYPGFPELSFFLREKRSLAARAVPLQSGTRQGMEEVQPGRFKISGDDPWIELRLESPESIISPLLLIEYELSGTNLSADAAVPGRLYSAPEGAAFSEEFAVPLVLRGTGVRRGLFNLSPPATMQNKPMVIQRVRLDPIQDTKKFDDISISIKSVSIVNFQ